MMLDLTPQEAALLSRELDRRIFELDRDLVRTDKHELQHALARDIEELRMIEKRLVELSDMRMDEDVV